MYVWFCRSTHYSEDSLSVTPYLTTRHWDLLRRSSSRSLSGCDTSSRRKSRWGSLCYKKEKVQKWLRVGPIRYVSSPQFSKILLATRVEVKPLTPDYLVLRKRRPGGYNFLGGRTGRTEERKQKKNVLRSPESHGLYVFTH